MIRLKFQGQDLEISNVFQDPESSGKKFTKKFKTSWLAMLNTIRRKQTT